MSKQSPTQEFLEIDQVREGIVILKNKSLRGVLMVSSLNFALTSADEQNAITYQFQNFLNSLDFSCQIVTQTRKLNVAGYIEKLKELEQNQPNELLKIQTTGYREFIETLVAGGTIMTKTFFIIVPFYLLNIPKSSGFGSFLKVPTVPKLTETEFQRSKNQLWQRMEFLALGLRRCGLRAVPLTTTELIELFWALYHPQEAEVGFYPEIPPELAR
jgi:type IV secretory pathway VirB4 component